MWYYIEIWASFYLNLWFPNHMGPEMRDHRGQNGILDGLHSQGRVAWITGLCTGLLNEWSRVSMSAFKRYNCQKTARSLQYASSSGHSHMSMWHDQLWPWDQLMDSIVNNTCSLELATYIKQWHCFDVVCRGHVQCKIWQLDNGAHCLRESGHYVSGALPEQTVCCAPLP